MAKRLAPSPRTAEIYFDRIKDHRFKVIIQEHKHVHPNLGPFTEEIRKFENEELVLQTVRSVLEWDDVELMIEGDYRPPGQYSFNCYTLLISRDGAPLHGFFGY